MAAAAFRPPPTIDPVTGLPIAGVPIVPGLPVYPGIPGVNELFSPTFGYNETLMRGAENAIAGGFAGSGFGGAQTNRLLDSERKANLIAGHQILEPYLNRQFQAGESAADRASRLNEIAARGAQALQELQIQEAGDTTRQTQAERAQSERDVLLGQQAMRELTLREAGDTSRTRLGIGGNLANTLLQGAIRGGGAAGGTARAPFIPGATYGSPSNVNLFDAPLAYNPAARGESPDSTLGSSSIDQILRRYGLLN